MYFESFGNKGGSKKSKENPIPAKINSSSVKNKAEYGSIYDIMFKLTSIKGYE